MYESHTLVGHVGKDAEVKQSKAGNDYIILSVATKKYNKARSQPGKPEYDTTWNSVLVVGNSVQYVSNIKTGDMVLVESNSVDVGVWQDKEGNNHTEVKYMSGNVKVLHRKDGSATTGGTATGHQSTQRTQQAQQPTAVVDDDIPF